MPTQRKKSTESSGLEQQAKAFGCPDLVHLGVELTAAHLDYLDLHRQRGSAMLLPAAVAEYQGRPVMYLLDAAGETALFTADEDAIRDLQQLLANRSEQACLGIVRPGSLEVYPINLDREKLAHSVPRIVQVQSPEAPTFFQSLATGAFKPEGQPKEADSVFHEIHNLLQRAADGLSGRLEPLDVLSVTGRALFYRFLLDRGIIGDAERDEICPKATELADAFSTAEKAAATSCWLDETFNGDLLPLMPGLTADSRAADRLAAYLRFYRKAGTATNQEVFLHLQAILCGWESVGSSQFQLRLIIDWDDFDFAHIPIGVLSQVYETFSRQWDEAQSEETSVYYTPKNIARSLVEEAFAGLADPAEAHVLDPASGAGIFLVLAFRRLVKARWERDGVRPDTKTIQRILYQQVCGFDVSESALRLAALALYITAIELNGSPRPPKSLKFPRDLRGHVLFHFGNQDGTKGFALGSLGPSVPKRFDGAFEMVVTNPPWSRLRASSITGNDAETEKARLDALNEVFTAITCRALKNRGLEDAAKGYTNPDNNPDLPFIWRATEWVKPGGILAMALPGRILLKQTEQGKAARVALMRGLSVTGIINCLHLPETAVWPRMKQPFMLFFARNALPAANHRFQFATPVRERRLNDRGIFRIDYQSAEPVAISDVIEKPWLLKALSLGSTLDANLMDGLCSGAWKSIGEFWKPPLLISSTGYIISDTLPKTSAPFLAKLPDFEPPIDGFRVDISTLTTFAARYHRQSANRPRSEQIYAAPLLIVPQAPREGRELPKSFRLHESVAYSQSYYGFSAAGHPDAELLVSLLYLITHSLLFQYFCLLISSRLGAERRTFIKVDLEAFPFPDPAKLTAAQKRTVFDLAAKLEANGTRPWKALDRFVFGLYGFDEHDVQVAADTMDFGVPYQTSRERAEFPPSAAEATAFCTYLEEMLQPSFAVARQKVRVAEVPPVKSEWNPPWRFLIITLAGDQPPVRAPLLRKLIDEANRACVSRVVMRFPGGGLLLGMMNQGRFWTLSRARLCGLHLQRHHLSAFPLPVQP
jgi:hypothetical protein